MQDQITISDSEKLDEEIIDDASLQLNDSDPEDEIPDFDTDDAM
jgi:hypothetical protein